ncbi:MAG TPA: lactoylglutathione lyase [Lachnospiraceae bacterium]|nr:lactoylglutathione lyase [Lachnospiraceae bacterium]
MTHFNIHHIGYLVKKIDKAMEAFQHLGYSAVSDIIYDGGRKVHICFMEKDGYRIELVSPGDSSSVVSGLLKKYKNSPYHICYETADFETDFASLSAEGFTAIDTPTPAPALGGRRVVFLMNPFLGMIELLETP